eukprot:CAMPEP_0202980360 /NCGR_PEP_ID=MMETSP1396-20130829/86301_1 /ASSEMBLY_ACC=CAM_ASM_000872 /TAXON_ID= /ORGANISM="Pseudokeronopsis sp., Strain Brazil" /LENGTH=65 /DNA_ID=CAMNT_0049720295 /DNA_START=2952 /DNA_END=3149 /DNA_ORIENTATION=+
MNSNNGTVREQGDILFGILEGMADPNLIVQPLTAQLNLITNTRAKISLIEKLAGVCERVDKAQVV